ncbi:MAG: PhoH family protein [Neomegalonema sp.]|nr:PhoH family protein [Neomegalonema sp.]
MMKVEHGPEHTVIEFDDNRLLVEICGSHDRNLVAIEQGADVTIIRRGNLLQVQGEMASREQVAHVLEDLGARAAGGNHVEAAQVDAAIRLQPEQSAVNGDGSGRIAINTRKKTVEPRTEGQRDYVRALFEHDLVFGVGPAGTGKTYLAVAVGVSMMLEGHVDKLILSRPAVEAGERLGFLPGGMEEKIDPYLRPLYDSLHDLWPGSKLEKLREEGKIEIAPLAFMRGRTLRNAFVILDEAQNTTDMQMRMFLTRLGENSRMVVTGDPTQIDLPGGVRSGLKEAMRVLRKVKGIEFVYLTADDVVRHKLVTRIINAYAEIDAKR